MEHAEAFSHNDGMTDSLESLTKYLLIHQTTCHVDQLNLPILIRLENNKKNHCSSLLFTLLHFTLCGFFCKNIVKFSTDVTPAEVLHDDAVGVVYQQKKKKKKKNFT